LLGVAASDFAKTCVRHNNHELKLAPSLSCRSASFYTHYFHNF
jgi:hypothetical protein